MSSCSRFCAADIGSNSIKVRIVEVAEGLRKTLHEVRYPVRLGSSVFDNGKLASDTIEAALGSFQEISSLCQNFGVLRKRIVATSAMREASNSHALIDAVAKTCGLRIEVISGTEEARLLALGLKSELDEGKHNLIIDIGGGSTELIYTTEHGDIDTVHSIRLGAVRLRQMVKGDWPVSKHDWELMQSCVESVLAKCHLPVISRKSNVIGVAGTMGAIAEIVQGPKNSFTARDLEKTLLTVRDMTCREMEQQLGVDQRRASILIPGMLIAAGILDLYSIERVTYSNRGLRDGVLEELIENTDALHAPTDLFAFAHALGEKYHYDAPHARQVARLALSLFDQLQSVHTLERQHRDYLHMAAILHDIGQFITFSRHHKHSYYLIVNEDLPSLTNQQQLMIAAIARYHRKSMPKVHHEEFTRLPPEFQASVSHCAAILRIADAFDHGHRQLVESILVETTDKEIRLTAIADEHIFLELSAAEKKGQLFEALTRKKLTIRHSSTTNDTWVGD